MTSVGMIHGRFQPFHNGHLGCLQWLNNECDKLIVGITNPDSRDYKESKLALHRHKQEANPFTYYERYEMILAGAVQLGIPFKCLRIIPFFLNQPDSWHFYFPSNCTHYVTILSEWEASKVVLMKKAGLAVQTRHVEKLISGTNIRKALSNGENVDKFIPEGVGEIIKQSGCFIINQ